MVINTDEQSVFTPEMIKNSTMSGDNADVPYPDWA